MHKVTVLLEIHCVLSEHLSLNHLTIDSRIVWFRSSTWLGKQLEIIQY